MLDSEVPVIFKETTASFASSWGLHENAANAIAAIMPALISFANNFFIIHGFYVVGTKLPTDEISGNL